MKTECKQTPIGRIPEEWEVVRTEDLFSLEYGKGLTEKQRESGEFPVFGSNGIVGYHSQYLVKAPGIIVGRKGTIGAITWSEKNFWPIDTTYRIELKRPDIYLKWLFYKLISLHLARLNMATGTPGLNRNLVYSLKIPFPPFPEQQKIAKILSTVDSAIQKVDDAIAKTERLKKGLMQELLIKGIGHKRFKDTKIWRIPEEWKVVRLGDEDVAHLNMGQSPPSSTYNKKEIGLPFFQGNAEFGETRPTPTFYCSEPIKIAEKNDILLSVRAPVGDINIASFKCCIGRGLAAIRAKNDKLEYLFLFYYLKFGSRRFKSLSMGSTFKAIRKREIEKYKIPLPPLLEQKKITEILNTVDKKLELERKRREKLMRIKKGLMNDLLTGKKRVKVEV